MQTLEDYQKLKLKYEKLKKSYKYIQNNLKECCDHSMSLESEILDINTKTMQQITNNNKRFNNN